jgi:tRNA-Thr(GGU) m(6)t(6)A37 methyltransferase TsaA
LPKQISHDIEGHIKQNERNNFMDEIILKPIGIIHTPYNKPKGTPIQPSKSEKATGTIEVYKEYEPGLDDLDGFSHIMVFFCFHLSKGFELKVVPYLDTQKRGLFATRAPRRPNPIGLSVVRLHKIDKNTLTIGDSDIVDGTPLIDIKPYLPPFDYVSDMRIGWLEGKTHEAGKRNANGRFHD